MNDDKAVFTLASAPPEKQGIDNAAINHKEPPEYNNVMTSSHADTYYKIEDAKEAAEERKSRRSSSSSSEGDHEIITSTF